MIFIIKLEKRYWIKVIYEWEVKIRRLLDAKMLVSLFIFHEWMLFCSLIIHNNITLYYIDIAVPHYNRNATEVYWIDIADS